MRINCLILAIFLCPRLFAQTIITVNVNSPLNDVSLDPVGINMNYLMDDDSYLKPARSTTNALLAMGVKHLRYPGGEKSDNYLWSVSPWTSANAKYARTGTCDWPSADTKFSLSDRSAPKATTLDFDEFMVMAKATGAEPLIVVPYDAMYKVACGGIIPTKEQLLRNAEEWVRYANITKKFGIKYWMVGNESFMDSYNGMATASQYRDDIIEFSKRMKSVDPTIKIVANGDNATWWQTVLPNAAPYIDFLGLSNYPVWNWTGGYDYYRTNTPNLMGVVQTAINAITNYAPIADQSRLKIISTEFNSMDWSGAWPDNNDVGHALVAFEMMGEHLKNPKVHSAYFWNTRWVNNDTKPSDIYDALTKTGSFNANGTALAIWGNFLENTMVSTSGSTSNVRTFASYNGATKKLNVYIINKETSTTSISLSLQNYLTNSTGTRWEFKGTGPTDIAPTWSKTGTLNATTSVSLTLPPVSITMLELAPADAQVPTSPTLVSTGVTSTSVSLSWSGATDNVGVTGYDLYMGSSKVNTSDITATTYTVSGLSANTKYSFTVKAKDAAGNISVASNVVTVSTSIITAIGNQLSEGKSELFPNPVTDRVNISFHSLEGVVKINIVDMVSRKHFEQVVNTVIEGKTLEISVTDLEAGTYFLNISNSEKQEVHRILIVN
ncbi:MAG TPA: T9SS type A sorting domain-containing protein [Cytophagaceae bacterium]|jgi:alpha-L-arabinofuranosidase